MDKGKLTQEERGLLRRNPNVKRVYEKRIIYTNDFKLHFIEEYTHGKKPQCIFEEAGFDPAVLGNKRIERASARWRKAYIEGKLTR